MLLSQTKELNCWFVVNSIRVIQTLPIDAVHDKITEFFGISGKLHSRSAFSVTFCFVLVISNPEISSCVNQGVFPLLQYLSFFLDGVDPPNISQISPSSFSSQFFGKLIASPLKQILCLQFSLWLFLTVL